MLPYRVLINEVPVAVYSVDLLIIMTWMDNGYCIIMNWIPI